MEFFYIIVFITYICIPIFICLNIFSTNNDKIRKNRIKHGFVSIITTIINIILVVSIFFIKDIDKFLGNSYLLIIPVLLLLTCLISYNTGKKKEKIIQTELASDEIDNVRKLRNNSVQTIDMTYIDLSSYDNEKL